MTKEEEEKLKLEAEEKKKKDAEEQKKKDAEVPKDTNGTPTVQNSEKKEPEDPLLKELDTELKEKLGEEIYKEYATYPLRERVSMLRAISKGIDKLKGQASQQPANNPAVPPANPKTKPKTLVELNDKENYFGKLQAKTSFANKTQGWLK